MNLSCKTFYFSFVSALLVLQSAGFAKQNKVYVKEEKRIILQNVRGKLDHLAYDPINKHVFVAAKTNNTVEVADIKNGTHIRSIRGLDEPQGIIYLPNKKSIMVTNGGSGACNVFNTPAFNLTETIYFPEDADNIRYAPDKRKIYMGHGAGEIAEIDPRTMRITGSIKIDGHPESFQIDEHSSRLYVNVPTSRTIEVADLNSNKIIAQWFTGNNKWNYSLAIDTISDRLFVVYRKPAMLEVRGLRTGKVVAQVECSEDCDDIFYNSIEKELYLICGSGYIDVIKQMNADNYKLVSRVTTRRGARTGLFVPSLLKLFVALPEYADEKAELRVYRLTD